jgi:hypothetical protein
VTLTERIRELFEESVVEARISSDYLQGRRDALREALEIVEEEED